MIAALLLAALLAAQPAAAGDALALYRMASTYETSAVRRSCADATLGPRLAAARRRLRQAERRLAARYGRAALRRNQVALLVSGDPCANRAAAANSLAGFQDAAERLEAALAGARRR